MATRIRMPALWAVLLCGMARSPGARGAPAEVVTPAPRRDALFYEDFGRYDPGPVAGYQNGQVMVEGPLRFLRASGENVAGNSIGFFTARFGRTWPAYAFRFSVRFVDAVKELQVFFKCWGERPAAGYGRYCIALTADRLALTCEGIQKPTPPGAAGTPAAPHAPKPLPPPVTFASVGVSPLVAGTWYEMELQVLDERVRLLIRQGDAWAKLLDAEVERGTGAPNFGARTQQIDLGTMVVTELPEGPTAGRR
jgi:hypothetical protein